MSFNLEPSKSYIYSKASEIDYAPIYFNNSSIKETSKQKNFGMLLDSKLDF